MVLEEDWIEFFNNNDKLTNKQLENSNNIDYIINEIISKSNNISNYQLNGYFNENDFNLYVYLKKLIQSKLSNKVINDIINFYYYNEDKELFIKCCNNYINSVELLDIINNLNEDTFEIFIFSLYLLLLKTDIFKMINEYKRSLYDEITGLNKLTLYSNQLYSEISYKLRVYMISLIKNINQINSSNFNNLYQSLKNKINIEDVYLLIMNECLNQSILSNAGLSFEDNIEELLISNKISNYKKYQYDNSEKMTEYDFYFKLNNRSFGISAKTSLRERHKQFQKTENTETDVLIQITIGNDISKQVIENIRNNNIYIFIYDEIYNNNNYMTGIYGLYPISQFSKELLENLK